MADLFAPPTKEELAALSAHNPMETDLFAPPTKEEMAMLSGPTSKLESGARGLAQGASMGFSDELTGALESALTDKSYEQARDEARANNAKAKKDNPLSYGAGEVGGGVATALIPGMNIAKGASLGKAVLQGGLQGAGMGGAYGLGNSEADNVRDMALDTGKGALVGGTIGAAAGALTPVAGKFKDYLGNKLRGGAEDLAVNATGATGVQSSKFADDAGRQLLDRKMVRPFDNSKNISDRLTGEMTKANSMIDDALKGLDAQGATANVDDIVAKLEAKASSLDADPSQAGVARQLRSMIDDIYKSGNSEVSLSAAEQTKRGFSKKAGNWMDPEVGQAGKKAYLGYRDEVERAALEANPKLGQMFKDGKETYGLLSPIQEAAERRALQQNQSPWGGLGDMAAAAVGSASGGPITALPAVAAKKVLFPRLTSTAAVGMDAMSNVLLKSPAMTHMLEKNPAVFNAFANRMRGQMQKTKPPRSAEQQNTLPDKTSLIEKTQGSKYGQVLQNAAQKGDQSFAAAHYVLSSRDPNYRKLLEGGTDDVDQDM